MSELRTSPEFDDILAECLDDMLRGRKSLADCLAAYPDYASELKPLLQTGLLTARLKSPAMSVDRVNVLEERLRAQMPKVPPRHNIKWLPLGVSRLAAAIVVIFILALGSGAGLVAASADDLPGDSLYGVKRLWESIVLAFSPLTGQPQDLWLHIANTRLDEVDALSKQGRLTQNALVDLYQATYHVSQYGYGHGDASPIIAYFSRAYLAFTNRITSPKGAEAIYQDVVQAVAPSHIQNGGVMPLTSDVPPSLSGTPTVVLSPIPPTSTPSFTPSPTDTSSPTPTTTLSPTATETPTITPSPTPRIPATATRTPTLTPSATYTPTFTPSPTLTWTPLPLPGLPTISSAATAIPTQKLPPTMTVIQPTLDATERVRATQASVYMTQTAGPPTEMP